MPDHIDWGGILPAVNLCLILFMGLVGLATIKSSLKEIMAFVKRATDQMVENARDIAQMRSAVEYLHEEVKRARDRLDDLEK